MPQDRLLQPLPIIFGKISLLKYHLILFPVSLLKKVINELTIIKHER